jgi:choline dehydrogenase-like flavoprotein
LVFLALATPAIGRRLVSEAIRISHLGSSSRDYIQHLLNVLRSPRITAVEIWQVLRDRYLSEPAKPGFIVRNESGRYALHYHAEQRPNPDSRVTLADCVDDLGVPRIKIDLRYQAEDADSVLKAHAHVGASLAESGLGRLEHWYPEGERFERVMVQATDGFHQLGTTRMSICAQHGVVDKHCRVHGIDNLYVASTSVFPTSGQANPTFAAIALALRLARRLSGSPRAVGSG